MRNQQATLDGMDRDSLIAYVVDRALEHGGDQESLFADLRNKLAGTEVYAENDDLSQGQLFAICALFVFQEVEGGAEQLRKIRDKHRLLAAGVPKQRGWRGWGG
jgi:hypothetical protein